MASVAQLFHGAAWKEVLIVRLTVGTLRRIIRESPIADVLPMVSSRSNNDNTDHGSSKQDEKQVEKLFNGKKFRDDLVKKFAILSVPIFVIPQYTNDYQSNYRVRNNDGLQSLGLSDGKIQELKSALSQGSTVFVVRSSGLVEDFLPTPWIIVHSMFDDINVSQVQGSAFKQLVNLINKLLATAKVTLDPSRISPNGTTDEGTASTRKLWHKCLTMKSARDNQLVGVSDTVAEIMCQAILTKAGFTFNSSGKPKIDALFQKISKVTQYARAEFEASIKGQVLHIDTSFKF